MASTNVVEQYVAEFGYKPESLQKLMNFVKDKGISMKYSKVKKAFERIKEDTQSTPNRDIIKSEATNLNVNKSKIDIDLIPTPEAEQAHSNTDDAHKKQETESKTWTFDVTKALEAIQIFERLHKDTNINSELLPHILKWANNEENKYGITLSELKQAFTQKKQFETMDLPSNKKKKRKQKKVKKKDIKHKDDINSEIIECKSMKDFSQNDALRDVLTIYYKEWNHEPLNGKQLKNFITERGLDKKEDKYKEINFEMINKLFNEYGEYKKQIEIRNKRNDETKKKRLDTFNCRNVLDKYLETHNEPKDTTMFYKYVLELGYEMEFKELDDAYNEAKGVEKKKKKTVKIKRTSKRLKSLYKKSHQ